MILYRCLAGGVLLLRRGLGRSGRYAGRAPCLARSTEKSPVYMSDCVSFDRSAAAKEEIAKEGAEGEAKEGADEQTGPTLSEEELAAIAAKKKEQEEEEKVRERGWGPNMVYGPYHVVLF